MDSQMIKDLVKLVFSEEEVNRTRESGFAETSHEVSQSSVRSWRNLSHVSMDEGCFTDNAQASYGRGVILGTALSAGGNNLSHVVPNRATVAKYMAQYQGFIQQCCRGLIQLRKYAGMLDGNTSSSNFEDELNLENYVAASQAECLRLKSMNLSSIHPLLLKWSFLLARVQQHIKEERECCDTVRQLRRVVSLISFGLFTELYGRDKIQRDHYEFGIRRSQMIWNLLQNMKI